jgi:flagellar biosynthesis protein FlhA
LDNKIIESRFESSDGEVFAVLEPSEHGLWIKALSEKLKKMREKGTVPVILCSEAARRLVKNITRRAFPDLAVLSVNEIPADISVESMGTISLAKE